MDGVPIAVRHEQGAYPATELAGIGRLHRVGDQWCTHLGNGGGAVNGTARTLEQRVLVAWWTKARLALQARSTVRRWTDIFTAQTGEADLG
jgi:hypothetical protein